MESAQLDTDKVFLLRNNCIIIIIIISCQRQHHVAEHWFCRLRRTAITSSLLGENDVMLFRDARRRLKQDLPNFSAAARKRVILHNINNWPSPLHRSRARPHAITRRISTPVRSRRCQAR